MPPHTLPPPALPPHTLLHISASPRRDASNLSVLHLHRLRRGPDAVAQAESQAETWIEQQTTWLRTIS